MSSPLKVIIQGKTESGGKFRPSDWAERLSGAVSTYDRNRRMIFHPNVRLATMEGVKCVVVDACLEEEDAMLFDFLMNFAEENKLVVKLTDIEPEA